MENQKKTLLTRDIVARDLSDRNKERFRDNSMFLAVWLLAIPIAFGIGYLISTASSDHPWLSVTLSLVFTVPFWFPIISILISLLRAVAERRKINNGEFDIVRRGLAYKSEEYRGRFGSRGGHLEYYIHFKGFKKYASRADYTSAGDVYYIVHYKNNDKIELLYSADNYECECASK